MSGQINENQEGRIKTVIRSVIKQTTVTAHENKVNARTFKPGLTAEADHQQ